METGALYEIGKKYNIELNTPFWVENNRRSKYILNEKGILIEYYTFNPYVEEGKSQTFTRTDKSIFDLLDELNKKKLKVVYSVDECRCICHASNLSINTQNHGDDCCHSYFDFKKSEIITKYDDDGSVYYQKSMPIKYCPFCGRSLKEK